MLPNCTGMLLLKNFQVWWNINSVYTTCEKVKTVFPTHMSTKLMIKFLNKRLNVEAKVNMSQIFRKPNSWAILP